MDFAVALIEAARAENIHVAVETTGYTSPERFRRFAPLPDLYLFDFKHYDREMHHQGTGVYTTTSSWKTLRAGGGHGREVIARIPVIPGFNTGLLRARGMAQALVDAGVRTVHLLPFHQFGEKKYEELGVPYEYKGVKQLHPEVLGRYRQEFVDRGLLCSFK